MEKVFQYPLPEERIMRITYKDYLFKWEVDIIENPNNHFKAEDQRRFGVYSYHFQSIDRIEKDPWHQEIPKEIHDKIKEFIQENLTDEDRKKSNEAESKVEYYYWEPVTTDETDSQAENEREGKN